MFSKTSFSQLPAVATLILLLSIAANIIISELLTPQYLSTSVKAVQKSGQTEEITKLPITNFQKSWLSLEIFFRLSYFLPEALEVKVDDCLHFIEINGKVPETSPAPFCDYKKPRTVKVDQYITDGDNLIHATFENKGGAGLFNIRPVWGKQATITTNLIQLIFSFLLALGCSRFFTLSLSKASALAIIGYLITPMAYRIAFELQGPTTCDAPLYWAQAQALLKGYRIYPDFFESKSPLIMILSIPVVLSANPFLTSAIIQTSFILLLFGLFLKIGLKNLSVSTSGGISIIITGALISLFTAVRAGEFQTESFGAIVGVIYLYHFMKEKNYGWPYMLYSGLLLFVAVGLKEPFLLSILAGLIITAGSIRHFYRGFIIPCMVAGLMGLILFAVFGWLEDYLFIYMRYMLFGYTRINHTSAWQLGWKILPLFNDLKDFSVFFPFTLLFLAACIPFGGFLKNKMPVLAFFQKVICLLAGVSLICIAVGIGRHYYSHYFVFSVPFYAALVFKGIPAIEGIKSFWLKRLLYISLICLVSLGWIKVNIGELDIYKAHHASYRKDSLILAQYIDNMISGCGLDKYIWIGNPDPLPRLGVTENVPYAALNTDFSDLFTSNPELMSYMQEKISAARPFAVVTYPTALKYYLNGYFNPQLGNYIEGLPECAGPAPDEIKSVKFLFPKNTF